MNSQDNSKILFSIILSMEMKETSMVMNFKANNGVKYKGCRIISKHRIKDKILSSINNKHQISTKTIQKKDSNRIIKNRRIRQFLFCLHM